MASNASPRGRSLYQSDCLLTSQKGTQYQRLAGIALDLMTIPPISSDPERTFSLTGLLLTANRARLQPDIIGVSMAVGS
jgi:hypothetical protein